MPMMTRSRRRMMAEATTESPCTVLPEELMIEILLRVESSNPMQLRCVCKLWKSLVVDPQFMENHMTRSITHIPDLLSKAFEHYHAFKSQYLTNNLIVPQEEEQDNEEKQSLMNAFAQLDNLMVNLHNNLCEEEDKDKEKHWMMKHIAWFDHLLVVVRYMKVNFVTMTDIMQNLEDRVKCRQTCMRIYLKSATSTSS